MPACPLCDEPLPAEVVTGPADAQFRCGGCSVALTWKNGAAVPTPRSSAPVRPSAPIVSPWVSASGLLPPAPSGPAPLPRTTAPLPRPRPSAPVTSASPWSDSTSIEPPAGYHPRTVELPRPSVSTEAAVPSWLESAAADVPPSYPAEQWSDPAPAYAPEQWSDPAPAYPAEQWSDATSVGPPSQPDPQWSDPAPGYPAEQWSDATSVGPPSQPAPQWSDPAPASPAEQWSDATSVEALGHSAPEPTAVDRPAVQPAWMDSTLVRPPAAPTTGAPLPRTPTGTFPKARPSAPIPKSTQVFGTYSGPAPVKPPQAIPTGTQAFGSFGPSKTITSEQVPTTTQTFGYVPPSGPSSAPELTRVPKSPTGSFPRARPSAPRPAATAPAPPAEVTVMARAPTGTPPKGAVLGRMTLDQSAPELTATAAPTPPSPAPASMRDTAASLRPIDDAPTEMTAGLAAAASDSPAEPASDFEAEPNDAAAAVNEAAQTNDAPDASPKTRSDRPSKPVRRVLAAAAKAQQPFPLKKALIIGAPVAALLLGLSIWLIARRSPAPPPPPAVVEIPLPPEPAPVVVAPPAPPVEEIKPPVAAVPMLDGKPMVLEGDKGPDVEVAGANPAQVAKARAAYRNGNARLAAGDKKGALKLFRASLKAYPGYVAAYRGLGRALAATGDKKAAIKVLKAYVKAVPEADDVASINKLIDKLGKKAPARRK
jgi:hypothetical protein